MKTFLGKMFSTGEIREPSGLVKVLMLIMIVGIILFQFWAALFGALDPFLHNSIFISFMLAITFLVYSAGAGSKKNSIPFYDIAIAIVLVGIGVFMIVNSQRYLTRWPLADPLTPTEMILGVALLFVVYEATRRTLGFGMMVIVTILVLYAFFGHLIPGGFGHQPFSVMQFVDQMVYTGNGVFGTIASVAATYVFFFVLFGNLFSATGGGDFFYALSKAITGRVAGGPAKVAVISSGLYGSISGSPVADVATTGSFTIPAMKKVGYSATYAGAIEAAAATGGSMLPPVMGSAAFLMAEMTGIPYATIAMAALIPGLLYYFAMFLQIHFQAKKMKIQGYQGEELPTLWGVMKNMGQFTIPILVLIWFLKEGFTPVTGAIAASIATILVSYFKKETRLTPNKLFKTLNDTVTRISPLISVCAAAGLVAGVIQVTGLGGKFSILIHALSNGNLFISLLVTMVICGIFGMGMPTPAAYVLTAVLAAPILIEQGVPVLQAHLFIEYYACLSAITPPVAVAAFAAAAISQSNPMRIGLLGSRLAIVGFVIPFMFIYQPGLLLMDSVAGIVTSVITTLIGIVALSISMEGWFGKTISKGERILFGVMSLLAFLPFSIVKIIAILVIAIMIARKIPSFIADFKSNKKSNQTVLKEAKNVNVM